MHWFDISAFHRECHRVLKPGGTAVVLGYGTTSPTRKPQPSPYNTAFTAGFPFLTSSDASKSAAAHAALLRFNAALAPWWEARRRALVVSLYAGLDAPGQGAGLSDFKQVDDAGHYLRHDLPTAPGGDVSRQEYLLKGSFVEPRRYERPAPQDRGAPVEFSGVTRKTLSLEVAMPVAGLRGYLSTWSGYNTFLQDVAAVQSTADPLDTLCSELHDVLGERADDASALQVSWPCALLLATKP